MVISRLIPFWEEYFNFITSKQKSHLIVAHSNSLRAIVKILDKLSNDEIMTVNIPTGVPLVYEFDKNNNVLTKEYLINSDELQRKQDLVINQGKVEETGTHQELLDVDGLYAAMWRRQSRGFLKKN